MGKNNQTKATYSFKVHSQLVQETAISDTDQKLLRYASSMTIQSFWKKFLFGVAHKVHFLVYIKT